MRILDELVGFCCKRGAKDVNMNLSLGMHTTFLTVTAKIENLKSEDLENLNESLHSGRQHEVEECYWQVSGDDSFGDELMLTGVMIDGAEVTYKDNVIRIVARRVE